MLRVRTFRQLIHGASDCFGERPFFVDDRFLGTVSYTDLLRFSSGLEIQLDALGIPVGARVATLFNNCAMAALLFLGVIASGRVLVPLNPRTTRDELEYVLDKVACAAVIVDPVYATTRNYGGRTTIPVPDHHQYFARRYAERAAGSNVSRVANSMGFLSGEIVVSTGSSTRPSGVVLSEDSLICSAAALAEVYELRSADRFLTVCPLFQSNGQVFTTLACALTGGWTVAVDPDLAMRHFWGHVEKYRPSWSFSTPALLSALLADPEEPTYQAPTGGLLVASSASDATLVRRFETRFRIPVRMVYGRSETASISTCEYLDPEPRSLGSCGRPLPICRVRIDEKSISDSHRHGSGEHRRGEILISGANVFDGYVGNPGLSACRKCDGWLRTGDVGYFDELDNLFIVDRLDSAGARLAGCPS